MEKKECPYKNECLIPDCPEEEKPFFTRKQGEAFCPRYFAISGRPLNQSRKFVRKQNDLDRIKTGLMYPGRK